MNTSEPSIWSQLSEQLDEVFGARINPFNGDLPEYSASETIDILEAFSAERWQDIPPENLLASCSFPSFSSAPMIAFVLPAYLKLLLDSIDHGNDAADRILGNEVIERVAGQESWFDKSGSWRVAIELRKPERRLFGVILIELVQHGHIEFGATAQEHNPWWFRERNGT
jgi:hypothetical protein